MKNFRHLLLLVAICMAVPAVSQSGEPDYKSVYLNARKAVLYPSAYKEEGYLNFFESWMAIDRSASYNSILKNAENPSKELRLALDSLKTSYEFLIQIHPYNEVALDIWEGHK